MAQTYPYDDDYMTYDFDTHKYILTNQAVLDDLNINLITTLDPTNSASAQGNVQKFLKRISDIIYREIYKVSTNMYWVEYCMAKCPSARQKIKDAMEEQIESFMFNGDLSVYSGIDMKKNTVMPDISNRILCANARAILEQPLIETGLPLLYSGFYNVYFTVDYTANEY